MQNIETETKPLLKSIYNIFDRFGKGTSSQISISDIDHLKRVYENKINLESLDPEKTYFITYTAGRGKPTFYSANEFDIEYYKQFIDNNCTSNDIDKFERQTKIMFNLKENWFIF
jgi:hypothetical protein